MSRFLYNIFLFLFSIFAIFFLNILYINDWKISFNKFNDSGLNKNVKVFNESIKHNNDINLILGSSLVNSFLLEDWQKGGWKKFNNNTQNVFESYLFLNHYKEIINIDTLLIIMHPYDVREKIKENFDINSNGGFEIFKQGNNKNNRRRSFFAENLQFFINSNFQSLSIFVNRLIENPIESITHDYDFVNLFFTGVQNPPRIDAIKEFDLLAKELAKEVFYIITPKRDNYLDSIIMNEKYKSVWNYVKSYLKESRGNLIDLEYIFYNRNRDYFIDPIHLSENGAKAFTKIIKNRLKEN